MSGLLCKHLSMYAITNGITIISSSSSSQLKFDGRKRDADIQLHQPLSTEEKPSQCAPSTGTALSSSGFVNVMDLKGALVADEFLSSMECSAREQNRSNSVLVD